MRRFAHLPFVVLASFATGGCSGELATPPGGAADGSASDGAPADASGLDSTMDVESGSSDAGREDAAPTSEAGDAPNDGELDATRSVDGSTDASADTSAEADATPHSGTVVEFSIGRDAIQLIRGVDGNIWFSTQPVLSDAGTPDGDVGSITPAGTVTFYPRQTPNDFAPFQLAAAADGTIWYSNYGGDFGRILPLSVGAACDGGRFGETFAVPGYSTSSGVALDSQGNVWLICDANSWNALARFQPPAPCTTYPDASDGVSVFRTGLTTSLTASSISYPTNLLRGPDGAMWFGESGTSNVGRIAADGTISEYPLGVHTRGGIAAGPDGFVWFSYSDGVGKIDPITKAVSTYAVGSDDSAIAVGPDGNIWFYFGGPGVNELRRVRTDGTSLPSFSIPGVTQSIVAGSDGNMWFGDGLNHKIGYVVP